MGVPAIPNCLPRWHKRLLSVPKLIVSSGCPVVDGFTRCDPEVMRNRCESQLVTKGYWPAGRTLPLQTYTLARYITSEVGNGSPEDMVMVGTCAKNQAKHKGTTINGLLLTRNVLKIAAYGPIHGEGDSAPFGRWASTRSDPSVQALLVADMVLSGETATFAVDAYDQFGPNAGVSLKRKPSWVIDQIPNRARNGEYWIGPWPGVNWFKTFGFMHRPDIPANSTVGKFLQSRAIQALQPMLTQTSPKVDWSDTPMCGQEGLRLAGIPLWVFAVGGLGYYGYHRWKKYGRVLPSFRRS